MKRRLSSLRNFLGPRARAPVNLERTLQNIRAGKTGSLVELVDFFAEQKACHLAEALAFLEAVESRRTLGEIRDEFLARKQRPLFLSDVVIDQLLAADDVPCDVLQAAARCAFVTVVQSDGFNAYIRAAAVDLSRAPISLQNYDDDDDDDVNVSDLLKVARSHDQIADLVVYVGKHAGVEERYVLTSQLAYLRSLAEMDEAPSHLAAVAHASKIVALFVGPDARFRIKLSAYWKQEILAHAAGAFEASRSEVAREAVRSELVLNYLRRVHGAFDDDFDGRHGFSVASTVVSLES